MKANVHGTDANLKLIQISFTEREEEYWDIGKGRHYDEGKLINKVVLLSLCPAIAPSVDLKEKNCIDEGPRDEGAAEVLGPSDVGAPEVRLRQKNH